MKSIKLEITALSPLAIAVKKPGSVSEAEDHIPGSVIRGAIASHILQLSQQQRPGIAGENLASNGGDFSKLFLSDEAAIFHNAYPAIAKTSDSKSTVTDGEVMVLPATAVSAKNKSGFQPKGNGVFDTLIDRFCAEAYNYPFDPSDPKSLEEKTDARVEPYGGFYSCHNGQYYNHGVSKRFLTRVGINRRRATSEDEILYSIEVLNESFQNNSQGGTWQSVVYRSSIIVFDDELAKSLETFVNQNSPFFRLGGATSRGLGKVQIIAKSTDIDIINSTQVEDRIDKFNQKLQKRWELWSVFGNPVDNILERRKYFTIDLQADTILMDKYRRTTVITPRMLCNFLDLEFSESLKLEVAYTSYNYRSGWNSAWGLMKDMELVTNRGGVYLFSVDAKEYESIWLAKLTELELKGVGERRSEGFGQVQICNEFHCVMREEAK